MRFTQGNRRPEAPPQAAAIVGCGDELIRSNSDASTLAADNCDGVLNLNLNDSTKWTDEKHSLYLKHLEVSFVKQLHESMGLLAQCSEQNKRDEKVMTSADIPEYFTHCGTEYHLEVITSRGLETRSQQFSASSRYREGTGQNFVDEENQYKPNTQVSCEKRVEDRFCRLDEM